MPYEGEYAQYRSIKRIAESPRIKDLLGRCQIRNPDSDQFTPPKIINRSDLPASTWTPEWIIAVDGSHQEVPMKNGFPGAEAAYVTVASVVLNVARMVELDQVRPVDPRDFRRIEQADTIDSAFPGCNVIIKGETTAEGSLRRALHETLSNVRMIESGESLLDTFEALLDLKPKTEKQHCPYNDCQEPQQLFQRGKGNYACSCPLKKVLFSTDSLRIHEGMDPAGSNGAMYAEIMQVLERTWLIHILRTIERNNWLSSLKRIAFIMDGPLAVFGHPAWLSQAFTHELSRINKLAKEKNGDDILLVGIEKTGMFVDHLLSLDRHPDGTPGKLAAGSICLLDDNYIKRNVIFSDSTKVYGQDTYFGRKFFYKTSSGAFVVASVPLLNDKQKILTTAESDQFNRLSDSVNLLDRLVSSRYPNSLAPLISAHAEAAIPMNLGSRVLEKIARELVAKA